ncbi:MAG: hypothetical protein JW384_03419 [Nitrosomonadaceae bacterium]|nr:hypothetical protein [Nitrosomonadaceae bacterium]
MKKYTPKAGPMENCVYGHQGPTNQPMKDKVKNGLMKKAKKGGK